MAIAFAVLQTLVYTGGLSSQLRGLLLPLCYNIILAVSLNLTVGILGDLSLGHAGFMCAGAFMGAFVSKCLAVISPGCPDWLRLVLAFAAGGLAAALFGFIVRHSRIAAPRGLSCNRYACVRRDYVERVQRCTRCL